jgi:hypothetical protein
MRITVYYILYYNDIIHTKTVNNIPTIDFTHSCASNLEITNTILMVLFVQSEPFDNKILSIFD